MPVPGRPRLPRPSWLRMLWRVSRPLRSRSKPEGFILPCRPALADRPPSGPGWLHENQVRRLSRDCAEGRRSRAVMGADHVRLFEGVHAHPGRSRGAAGRERSARWRGDRYAIGRPVRFRGAEVTPRASRGDPGHLCTRAGWTSKASSRSGSGRAMSAAGHGHG